MLIQPTENVATFLQYDLLTDGILQKGLSILVGLQMPRYVQNL